MTDPRFVQPTRQSSDRAVFLGMAAMTAIALTAAFFSSRSINPLRGDSAEYLYFDPSRSVGYPAFLWAVKAVTGKVGLAVPLQMLVLAGSLLALGCSFHKSVGRPVVSFLFYTLLVAQAGMWFLSDFLMTESLATALTALWCAELLRMTREPLAGRRYELIALSALATMVRPSLFPLFFGSALFYIVTVRGRQRLQALTVTAAGFLIAWAATPAAQILVHGSSRTTSPLARGVLQHTLYCSLHRVPQDADAVFVENEAATVRRYIDAAPPTMQEQLRREYSTPLRFGLIIPVLGGRHHLDRRSEVDEYLSPIAAQRVSANPLCYARSVANEYLRLATFDTDPTSEDAGKINRFMQSHPPIEIPQYPLLPGDAEMARKAAREVEARPSGLNPEHLKLKVDGNIPFIALLPIRLLCAAASIIGLASLMALLVKQRLPRAFGQVVAATAAIGLAFHGALLITALVEIGFYRYLVPLWPAICTLAALGFFCAAHLRWRPEPLAEAGSAITE